MEKDTPRAIIQRTALATWIEPQQVAERWYEP